MMNRWALSADLPIEAEHPSGETRIAPRWPGPDFQVARFLPGSIYLWACGERSEEENDPSPPTHAEVVAAWVVLLTQTLCYAALVSVTGANPPDDAGARYSILSVAIAMYLVLTIAAPDVWGGIALAFERCIYGPQTTQRNGKLVRRWQFGMLLLLSFGTLITASMRVLFYTSVDDAELVIGAAAVLFISDVDEKAMVVLRNVDKKWRLLWVLEAMGLSICLAFIGIIGTENAGYVSQSSAHACDAGRVYEYATQSGCSIYDWSFGLSLLPITVTMGAILFNSFMVNPGILNVPSRSSRAQAALILCWLLSTFMGLYVPYGIALKVPAVLFTLCFGIYRGCKRVFCRPRQLQCGIKIPPTFGYVMPALLFVSGGILTFCEVITVSVLHGSDSELIYFFESLVLSVVWAWIVWAMIDRGSLDVASRTSPGGGGLPTDATNNDMPPWQALLLGWGTHFLLAVCAFWMYQVGGAYSWYFFILNTYVILLGMSIRVFEGRSVAFWIVATYLQEITIVTANMLSFAHQHGAIS